MDRVLYGDLIFARFFRILPDCPLIEYLKLGFDRKVVLSEEDLVQVKLMPRLPRPIHLEFQEPVSDFQMKLLVDLVRHHPEVRLKVSHFYYLKVESWTEFWHTICMNWHGRYLLDRPNVPLSVWPRVLEKVNNNYFVEDKARIIYELLKGLAETGRIIF